eukprot:scaffold9579_cov84-Cylindrotheca_fusiformis.AAC.1
MRQFVLDMRSQGFPVLFLRCDNAGENKATQSLFKEKNVHLKFEYTAPNTPQHNGKVERKFATFYGRVHAMLNGAGLQGELRDKLWAECGNTATIIDGLMVSEKTKKPQYTSFFKRDSGL